MASYSCDFEGIPKFQLLQIPIRDWKSDLIIDLPELIEFQLLQIPIRDWKAWCDQQS